MDNNALAKVDPRSVGYVRSVWSRYQEANWGWHVVVPLGLAGIAAGFLSWAWTMLDQNEYGAAMLLVLFFLVIGIGAAIAIPRRSLKAVAILCVAVITGFSGLKIWKERGDKAWTTIFRQVRAVPSPIPSPSPSPTATVSPSLPSQITSAVQPTPTPRRSVNRKVRTSKLSPAELRERQEILRALGSKKPEHAHASTQQQAGDRITKEQIKTALAKKRTKRGVELIVQEVRERGIVFVLTPEIEQELREFAKQHGNTSIDELMAVLNALSFMPRLESLRSEDGVLLSLIKGIQVKGKLDDLQMLDTLMKRAGYSGPILMSDLVITNDIASKDSIHVGISGLPDKSREVNPGSRYIFPNGENITKAYIFSISDVTIHISYKVANDQTLPFRDWLESDEAKQLVAQMTGEVQKLADEGRVMDLTDYDNALKTFQAWVDKCSIALGRIDIQMRRFKRNTDYKFEWDKNDRRVFESFGDKKQMLRLELNGAIAELDLVKANIRTETLPNIDSFRRP